MGLNHILDPLTAHIGDTLLQLWPLWALFALALVWPVGRSLYTQRRLARSGIADIDRMSGAEFERRLAILFRALGYRVELTGQAGDYGADLVLTKDGVRTAVQAKRWSKAVGVKAVQEVVAAKEMYHCGAALVVTNSGFTGQARTLARATGVALWDRGRLVQQLLATSAPAPESVPASVARPQPVSSPACPRCGAAMIRRVAGRGDQAGRPFWGCATFPACRGTREITDA